MIRNFLNNFNSPTEQALYEDLLNEFIQTWGMDIVYLPRASQSNSNYDLLFGDDPTKAYTSYYTLEMYVQSVDNFEGGELFSKFGLTVKKQARLLLTDRTFKREVGADLIRPQEGDLLWVPNFRALFEIKFVNEEYFFYAFNKQGFYGYSLIIEKFRISDEQIQTGIPTIDTVVNTLKFAYQFNMSNTNYTGSYILNELVYQTNNNNPTGNSTNYGTVVAWNLPTGNLILKDINGVFTVNANVFGNTSNAVWNVSTYDTIDSINHPLSDNDDIQTAANTILNWTEKNPFGDSV